jgi:hypothetical protein
MGHTPCPTKVNMGPGQAPVIAQPSPNMIPPIKYLGTLISFGLNVILEPDISDAFVFFMKNVIKAAKVTAVPIIPYIWKLSNRNIS